MTLEEIKFEPIWMCKKTGRVCRVHKTFLSRESGMAVLVRGIRGMNHFRTNTYGLIPLPLEPFLDKFEPTLEI